MLEYSTTTIWKGGHIGKLSCSNGAQIIFSAPKDLHGHEGMLTPEDAFVGALNTCFMLMFIWSVERLKIDLVSYECKVVGQVEEFLDKTSMFNRMTIKPKIIARDCTLDKILLALKLAEKYSLILQSIKAKISIDPEVQIIS